MNKDQFRVTILSEDTRHSHFVIGYLEKLGFKNKNIFEKFSPKGEGSGEQFVRDNFPKEVKAHRSKKCQNIILIVVTDADGYTYKNRLDTLTKTLQTTPLQPNERIIILIPARNIETWFWYADNSTNCNEQTDYKPKYKKVKPSNYGEKYAENICPNPLSNALSALTEACEEIKRLMSIL
jgi:hypothetical protein